MLKYLIVLDKIEGDSMKRENLAENLFQELRCNTSTSLGEILNEFSRGEIGVLGYLAFEKDEATAGELSEQLNVTTARVARILNSLEAKGYIKRTVDDFDKRKTLVVVTKNGKIFARKAKKEVVNKIAKVIDEIGEVEAKKYIQITLKIRDILNK